MVRKRFYGGLALPGCMKQKIDDERKVACEVKFRRRPPSRFWLVHAFVRVRSEDIGTDAELGSAKVSVLQAMGISPDQATVGR